MDRRNGSAMDKGVFIVLVIAASAAAIFAMVAGPLGYETLSVTASVCACLIAGALLWHALRAIGGRRR